MSLIARILEIIKEPIDCISPLPGGCINQVYSVKFKNGRQIVAKVGDTNSRFLVEEFMLNYLRENTILPVPNIYYSDNNLILMEFLGSCKALNTRTEREIADLIASLHNISADNFGFEKETLIGGLVQPNPISKNWRTFFRDQRLIYMADNAYQKGLLPLKSRQLIDKLCDNLERWISEQVRRRHRHDEPPIVTRLPKLADDPVAVWRRGVDWHQVVVVQVDAPGAHLGEQVDDLHRRQPRTHRIAERVATRIADRPQTERELVRGAWLVRVVRHENLPSGLACGV